MVEFVFHAYEEDDTLHVNAKDSCLKAAEIFTRGAKCIYLALILSNLFRQQAKGNHRTSRLIFIAVLDRAEHNSESFGTARQ
jgi:hypothetical protein